MRLVLVLLVGMIVHRSTCEWLSGQPPERQGSGHPVMAWPGIPPRQPAMNWVRPMPLRLIAAIDVDRDGRLSDEEIANVPEAIKQLDLDKNGIVDAEELGWWPQHFAPSTPSHDDRPRQPVSFDLPSKEPVRLSQVFTRFDANEDGSISRSELPESMQTLLLLMDQNENGAIDFAEVKQLEMLMKSAPDREPLLKRLTTEQTPPPQAVARIEEIIERGRVTLVANQQQVQAERRSSWLTYLFTVGAMLVGVVSFGHLLTSPPPIRSRWMEVDTSPHAIRPIVYSLILICLLSSIDLLWTKVRAETSHFVEMNPWGSQMLFDGVSPTIFKLATLAVSVLLLFSLRQFRGAQIASWWMCMVCTLLTFRWIMLDSAVFS